ncbi:MAG: MAPEG family protein [Acidiferrobacteraceae bacterium]
MHATITPELYWLILTVVMTGLLWVPYIVNRVIELGPPGFQWFPLPDPPPRAPWAARAMRAHANAIENLVIFVPLALGIQLTESGTPVTHWACAIYFFTRAGHYIVCVFGLPIPLRTLTFLIGVAAQLTLAVTLLHGA